MIKAEELRIGILLKDGEDIVKLTPELFAKILSKDANFEFDPITLTEEWLIKAGFEKEDMADLGIHVYIPISETADYCLSWSGGTIWLEQHDTGAKYVHQLQNLYFCLTGEEITFNL